MRVIEEPKNTPEPSSAHAVLAGALATPTLIQSLVFLAFGLVTVFWQDPTLSVITIILALYLLAYGVASYLTARALASAGDRVSRQAFTSMALVQAAGGALIFLAPRGEFWLTLIVSLVLGFTGVLKALAGLRAKEQNPVARDWQLEGLIITLTAAALPVVSEIGDKAIMGTAGGGALVAGVFVLIGALTVRFQAGKTREL